MKKRNHGVWKPKGSQFYYCRVMIKGVKYNRSTRQTEHKMAVLFAKRWKKQLLKTVEDEVGVKRMRFIDAIEGFLAFKKLKGKRQPYRDVDMIYLACQIGEDTDVSAVDNVMVGKVISERSKQPRWGRAECGSSKPSTVSQCVVHPLSAILHWARRHGKVRLPDMPDWGDFLVEPEPRTRELEFDEEIDLLPACGDFAPPVRFMLLSGLRLESALIEWKNVHREQGVIRVIVKGGKTHEVQITAEIADLLDEADIHQRGEYVFTYAKTTKSGIERRAITASNLSYRFNAATKKCGIKGLVIHDLRRTAGARMYRADGDIYAVSAFMGHSKIEITRKYYVHIRRGDIAKSMNAAARYNENNLSKVAQKRLAA